MEAQQPPLRDESGRVMKYRYYRITAVVAVAQYEMEDVCDEHAGLVSERTALDAVELLNDSDDCLLELEEVELHMVPRPRITVTDNGQGPLLPEMGKA